MRITATVPISEAPVEGGKVRQRLELFVQSRGIPVGTEAGPTSSEAAAWPMAQIYGETAAALSGAPETSALAPPGGPRPFPILGPAWRPLGPTAIPNGQTYGASRVVVSGRVSAVAIDPADRTHILCGSAGGGIWESRNSGASWAPRTDRMPTLTTGAIAFDPRATHTVYAGTGEGNWYRWLGQGVLRSTDGGQTWAVLAGNPFVGQGFYDLRVDPANGNHLLAATTGGVYESSNGGTTWTQRIARWAWTLSMHPAGGPTAEVLAACADGVYRSTDGGTTWALINLPGAPTWWSRLTVGHAPSNPAVAYAFGASGGAAYVWRRDASGTWQTVAPPPGLAIGQAWYDWFVAASPDSDSQVYLGAISVHRGELAAGTWTWTDIASKAVGDSIHPDQHAIAFDPVDPNIIYVGNDGGLFRSPNRGTNWTSLNNGLAITEVEYVAQDYGTCRWLLAGTQDNGSIRYTGSSVWEHVADGDGGDCGDNRTNSDTCFHSYYGMGMERSTSRGAWGTFGWIGPNVPAGYGALFYPPMGVDSSTVTQAGQSVYASRDNGTTWTDVALPTGLIASAIDVPSSDHVYVGTTAGRLFRIDWSGAAWSAATELTSPRAAWLSSIHVDPANLNRIWTTSTQVGGGRVFRSDDGGTHWLDRTLGLPALPINTIWSDPANPNRVWVGADLGVYQSWNAGANWANFSLGLPNVLVEDLKFQSHARLLRAGTRNRGVWEIPVDGDLTAPICGVQWTGSIPAHATQLWFTYNWPATWHVIWTIMPTSAAPGAPQVRWNVAVERAASEYVTYWITVVNLTGNPVNFEGRYCILSRG